MLRLPIDSIAPVVLGSPESVSFGLLIIFVAVLAVTLLSVVSAFFDVILYAGSVAVVIALLFYFIDPLSLDAAIEYMPFAVLVI